MSSGIKAAVIIAAAGSGSRMETTEPKQFLELAGKPVLVHAALAFLQTSAISSVILVIPESHQQQVTSLVNHYQLNSYAAQVEIVNGGSSRQESVANGLEVLGNDIDIVLIHDGARPLVSENIINDCLDSAAKNGAAIVAIPVKDTLKAVVGQQITTTVDRQGLWQAQTPQAARVELLKNALAVADADGFVGTDETSILERTGCRVEIVGGSERNIKITHPEDLLLAERLMKEDSPDQGAALRIGHGYDVHRLVEGRPFVLGGVEIEHEKGLLGHSDADVLTHAICDAVLGALGLDDIGVHFPDTDSAYKGISSLKLLEHVISIAGQKDFQVGNIDATVVAEQPKLAFYIEAMRANLAGCCRVSDGCVNVKATTTEGLGFTGRREGVAAHALVLLQHNSCTKTLRGEKRILHLFP